MKSIISIDPAGPQGNIFYILGVATGQLLKQGGKLNRDAAAEMRARVVNSHRYDEAVRIIEEYVTINWKGGVPM